MMKVRHALLVGLLIAVPGASEAQSVFNSAGLGRPIDAVDGRARALGSAGIGLRGASLSPTDPAAAARLGFASAIMVAQPSWTEVTNAGAPAGDFRGARFPLLGIGYPLKGGIATVQLGSMLDQRFEGSRTVSVEIGGAPVDIVDDFDQDGGVSTASLGFARGVTSEVAVGMNVSRYTGAVTRQLTRSFSGLGLEGAQSFSSGGRWSYSGFAVTAGASADLGTVGRAAASVRWSSDLKATASASTDGDSRTYDMPLEVRAGGSAVLAPGLIFVASGVLSDWKDVADDVLGPVAVGNANGFGVGLELSRFRMLGRSAPLRLGYRYTGLPFALGADEEGSERAFTGGFGFVFNETAGILLAGADLALERGERTAGSLTERFWRATASIRVSGF